ncbi:MAG TPA: hypothetical protein VIG46_03275 [Candidatus Baltobacteraceae bacterium]|jgi:hypothetical protein
MSGAGVMTVDALAAKMQAWGLLEAPAPEAALRWIATFIEAYGDRLTSVDDAYAPIVALRNEGCLIPALELERLRSRDVLFFLDTFAQHIDHQAELRGLDLRHDIGVMAGEFGIAADAGYDAVQMALTGETSGPPLELLAPLLGHDRILMRIGAVNSKLLHGRGLEPIAYGPDGKPFEPLRGTKPPE